MAELLDVIHHGCGGVAFRYIGPRPHITDVIDHTRVRLLDDSVPDLNDLIICGSCGQSVSPSDFAIKP